MQACLTVSVPTLHFLTLLSSGQKMEVICSSTLFAYNQNTTWVTTQKNMFILLCGLDCNFNLEYNSCAFLFWRTVHLDVKTHAILKESRTKRNINDDTCSLWSGWLFYWLDMFVFVLFIVNFLKCHWILLACGFR